MIVPALDSERLEDIFQDLVISVLSVNNYPLDKAYQLCSGLREAGLSDLSVFTGEPPSDCEIRGKLHAAGYRRGEYIESLISKRLGQIIKSIKDEGHVSFLSSLANDSEVIIQRLNSLYGVGPRVVSNFIHLRGPESRPDIKS